MNCAFLFRSVLAWMVLLGAPWYAGAQTPVFRSAVDIVQVDVRVVDGGKPVAGLGAEDFEVTDNGMTQRVRLSSTSGGVNVVLVLDISGSVMGERLAHLTAAARALLAGLTPRDTISLVTFSERLARPLSESGRPTDILANLDAVEAGGRTALNDAIYAGLAALARQEVGRSLVLVFSDGLDNASWLTDEQLQRSLERGGAVLYAVVPPGLRTPLRDFANRTGGDLLEVDPDARLTGTFVKILDRFRGGYLLTFTPEGVTRGDGWHKLEVRVKGRPGQVKARPGYQSR